MATKIGVWDPLSGRLPNIKDDITFAQYFVQNDGEYEDLNLSFKKGEWLVYLVDDNNESHWYKSNSGMITVSSIGNTNAPDSDWYTKIFINANGQITGGSTLSAEDLPPHTHTSEEIGQLDDSIWAVVAKIFQTQKYNNQGNVEFRVDENLKKITARVIVDEETIGTNEFGQLYAIASSNGGNGSIDKNLLSELETLKTAIENLKIEIDNKPNGSYLIDVNDIPIDEQTITINNAGQLQATAMKNQKHTHVLSDITDLPSFVKIAAKDQQLSLEIDTPLTAVNISGETIEKSFILINEYVKTLTDTVNELKSQSGKIKPAEPNNLSFATYKIDNAQTTVYNKYKKEVEAYIGPKISLSTIDGVYPPNKGILQIILDDVLIDSLDLTQDLKDGIVGNFNIMLRDSYEGNPNSIGFYKSLHFIWTSSSLADKPHTIQVAQTIGEKTYTSQQIKFNSVSKIKKLEPLISDTKTTDNDMYVSGIPCSKKETIKIQGTWKFMYNQEFYPKSFVTTNGEYNMTFVKNILTVDATKTFDINDATKALYIQIKDYDNLDVFKDTISATNLRYDNTFAETYRYIYSEKKQTYNEYNPKDKLPGGSAVILNSIMQVSKQNYSHINGPNYSDNDLIVAHNRACQEAVFCFECPEFINNFYVDIVDKYNTAFSVGIDGLIKGLTIDACLTNSYKPEYWASTYKSYNGNSNVLDKSFGALDLFRSTSKRKYMTFGKQPNINSGRLFVRFLIEDGYNLNIDTAVKSIVESISSQIGG